MTQYMTAFASCFFIHLHNVITNNIMLCCLSWSTPLYIGIIFVTLLHIGGVESNKLLSTDSFHNWEASLSVLQNNI